MWWWCRTKYAAVLLNVDDVDIVGANWTLATDDNHVANSNRLLWIGACLTKTLYTRCSKKRHKVYRAIILQINYVTESCGFQQDAQKKLFKNKLMVPKTLYRFFPKHPVFYRLAYRQLEGARDSAYLRQVKWFKHYYYYYYYCTRPTTTTTLTATTTPYKKDKKEEEERAGNCLPVYTAPLSKYGASKIMGSRPWFFGGQVTSSVMWPFDSRWSTSCGWSMVTMRLSGTVTEIWRIKDNGVTNLTCWGRVTSSVTWPFDSRWSTSYGWFIMTMRPSGTVTEIWRLKVDVDTQTDAHRDGQNDQSLNLLQCSLRWLDGDNKTQGVT